MARKKTRQTPTRLINPFSDLSVKPDKPPSGLSMRCYSEPVKANSERFWSAVNKMRTKLTLDFWEDTQDSLTSKKKSYLLTRNADGSLDLTDVQLGYPETTLEPDATYVCLVTSKTVKLL